MEIKSRNNADLRKAVIVMTGVTIDDSHAIVLGLVLADNSRRLMIIQEAEVIDPDACHDTIIEIGSVGTQTTKH